jgi:aspartate/methionine/tyrosine aminotransferase
MPGAAAPDVVKEKRMSTSEASFPAQVPALPNEPPARSVDRPPSTTAPRRADGAPHAARRRASGAPSTNGRAPASSLSAPATKTETEEARATLARLRLEICEHYRPEVAAGSAPIRVMARMVNELTRQARALELPADIVAAGVVNRTIGDVDLRSVSSTEDGPEFASLADDMGIALPDEVIGGHRAAGHTYRWIHERMLEIERQLLARGYDLRMYDLPATGNPLLRELLAAYEAERYGITLDPQLIHLSLGALDGLDKFWRGYSHTLRQQGVTQIGVVFPAPSFNVPEWQAVSLGLRLHRLSTRPEDHFKVTPTMLQAALDEAPDLRAFYLTVSNNPTAFAYSYEELRALFGVVQRADRELLVVADLAYIGTADPAADHTRMAAFVDGGILPRTVLVHSFSKTHTLTGDRCGWVGFSDPKLAAAVGPGWANSVATLPAEWQLRYTACVQLFRERPELEDRIRALYAHRRGRFVEQLRRLDAEHHLFAQINLDDGGTVYNWSQLRPGHDVFSLFANTGIAGVPGGAFGYSDDFVRFSIGCVPVPAV